MRRHTQPHAHIHMYTRETHTDIYEYKIKGLIINFYKYILVVCINTRIIISKRI